MSSVHGDGLDITLKAGTTSVATSTGQYLAVYMSAANAVAPVNTLTNFAAFVGITQDYAYASGGPVRVRVSGMSKATFSGTGTITAAGQYVAIDIATTTSWGKCHLQDRIAGADPTAGACLIIGQALAVSGASNSVQDIILRPQWSSAITSTVSK